jgi:hypothetical protein
MPYPHVRQLGPGAQLETEQRRSEGHQARRIALDARRRQELELQRPPVSGVSRQPIVNRSRAMRVCAAAAAIVVAIFIAYLAVA